MQELLVRGKNTIDQEVIDPGGRSVEDSPVKSDYTKAECFGQYLANAQTTPGTLYLKSNHTGYKI
jgi:hypothetical protein